MMKSSRTSSTASRPGHRLRSGLIVAASLMAIAGLFSQATVGRAAARPFARTSQAATVSSSSVYTPLASPQRLLNATTLDSSNGNMTTVTVTGGTTGVPATASAGVLTVTQLNNVASGFLKVYPAGGSTNASAVNYYFPNQLTSNLITVPVGAGGGVTVFSFVPDQVIVDEQGYYAAAATGSTAGKYNALTPARITDTRAASGQPNAAGTLASGGTLRIQVTGVGGVPTTGVSAVAVNLTAVDDPSAGFLQAYPGSRPTNPQTSNVNYNGGGQIVATRDIVSLDTTGGFTVYANVGPVDLVVDVNGWFTNATGTTGALFTPTNVSRLFDTRQSNQTVAAGGTLNVPVTGVGGIPAGATAGVLNVTIDKTTPNTTSHPYDTGPGQGFLTVYPGPTVATPPLASDLNFPPSSIVPNQVYGTLGSDGSINIYNGSPNAIDIIVDGYGFFSNLSVAPTPFTVTMSPNASVAVGGTTTITATVKDASGATVSGDTVNFTTPGGASCGLLGPASATTDSNGVASTTYTASGTPGTCVVTGTEQTDSASGTTTITQTAGGSSTPTAPLSTATASSLCATCSSTALAQGDGIQVTFNQSVAVAATFSLTLNDGVNQGTVSNVNATAVTSNGGQTVTFTITGPVFASPGPLVIASGIEVLRQAGVSDSAGQWNLPGSATATANGGATATTGLDREIGQNNNATLTAAPTVTSVDGSTGKVSLTCHNSTDTAYVYNPSGVQVGTATCTGGSQVITTSPAVTDGQVVYATEQSAAGYESLATAFTVAPYIVSATHSAVTLTVTYNEAVSCSATGTNGDWSGLALGGGSVTGCSASGSALTLVVNAATAAANLTYTEPGTPSTPSTTNAVYAGTTTPVYAATQTVTAT